MSIDGIGGPPRGPGPIGSPQAPEASSVGEAFHVDAPGAASQAPATDLLSRLERGEISVEAYLDGRVEAALAPLSSKLDPATLGFMRDALREQLSSDPVLAELARRATEGVSGG